MKAIVSTLPKLPNRPPSANRPSSVKVAIPDSFLSSPPSYSPGMDIAHLTFLYRNIIYSNYCFQDLNKCKGL